MQVLVFSETVLNEICNCFEVRKKVPIDVVHPDLLPDKGAENNGSGATRNTSYLTNKLC